MKSLCIKTNDSNLLAYLLKELDFLNLKDVCFCLKTFKHYNNIIIHYRGNNTKDFIHKISSILSFMVIDEMEENIFKSIIFRNYFYFDSQEMSQIYEICTDLMSDEFSEMFQKKWDCLYHSFSQLISHSKAIFLNGFINFRLQTYFSILDEIANEAVNCYVVEKEYSEFISLLKLYISTQSCTCHTVHLLYSNSSSILLDENKNTIELCDDIFKAKYLSDISFSTNDYILNTLLTLLPKQIEIHLIDGIGDEFIHTLQLIFENVKLCNDCQLCTIYKNGKMSSLPK